MDEILEPSADQWTEFLRDPCWLYVKDSIDNELVKVHGELERVETLQDLHFLQAHAFVLKHMKRITDKPWVNPREQETE